MAKIMNLKQKKQSMQQLMSFSRLTRHNQDACTGYHTFCKEKRAVKSLQSFAECGNLEVSLEVDEAILFGVVLESPRLRDTPCEVLV